MEGRSMVLEGAPVGFDGAILFQSEQLGIQSALVHRPQFTADLLDPASNSILMQEEISNDELVAR
jgi:hypothetical protein